MRSCMDVLQYKPRTFCYILRNLYTVQCTYRTFLQCFVGNLHACISLLGNLEPFAVPYWETYNYIEPFCSSFLQCIRALYILHAWETLNLFAVPQTYWET